MIAPIGGQNPPLEAMLPIVAATSLWSILFLLFALAGLWLHYRPSSTSESDPAAAMTPRELWWMAASAAFMIVLTAELCVSHLAEHPQRYGPILWGAALGAATVAVSAVLTWRWRPDHPETRTRTTTDADETGTDATILNDTDTRRNR